MAFPNVYHANLEFTIVDDQDFPPLPMKSSTAQPTELHTRVSSFQSFPGISTRSSTPRIPPGFETTHAHPNPLPDNSSERSSPIKLPGMTAPVVPAVPVLSNDQRGSTSKPKLSRPMDALFRAKEQDVTTTTEERSAIVTQPKSDSLAPKDEGNQPQQVVEKTENSVTDGKANDTVKDDTHQAKSTGIAVDLPKPKQIQPRPSKIEIPATSLTADAGVNVGPATEKVASSIADHNIVQTPSTIVSQPATPTTAVSEVSRVSGARPRTIRLTTSMIQKAEAANAASPATEKSAILPALSMTKEQHSRQPSLSSISRSRPSTPSISGPMMSQDVSRAGSPPPNNIVGSAPTRSKTKAQQKKERREKAKKTEDVIDSASVTSVPAAPVVEAVGPIVARQKKQKKSKTTGPPESVKVRDSQPTRTTLPNEAKISSDAHQASQSSKTPDDEILDEGEDEPDMDIKESVTEPAARRSYTVRDLCSDAAKMSNDPVAIQKLLAEHVTPMTKLVGEMLATGDLGRDHPWLMPPSFNSAAFKLPPDGRKGQEYLDGNGYSNNDAFGYVYLPQKEKRALYAGHAVSVADTGDRKNDLLRRCLITPNGWVMRHLSADESERVLELEERRSLYAEEFGDIGIMNGLGVLEQDDFVNLGGGIEELGRFGDRHGVCWVIGDEQGEDTIEGYDEVDEDDLLNELGVDGLSDDTDEDLGLDLNPGNQQMPGAWDQSFNTPMGNDLPPNTLPPINNGANRSVNLRAMDSDALHKRIHEKQKEVDTARKEAEKIDKALGKRSKEFARWKDAVLKV